MTEDNDASQPSDEDPDDETDGEESRRKAHPRPGLPSSWIAQGIGNHYSELFASLSKSLFVGLTPLNTANWFPYIKTTDVLLPQLKLPVSAMDSVLQQMSKDIAGTFGKQVFEPMTALIAQQHQQWDSLFETFRTLAEKLLPPNWRGVKHPDFATIEAILLDEGIPLAWVPSQEILQALFDSPDASARRRIIGRRWRGVVSDCEVILSEVSHPALQRHQSFGMDVVQALRDGHRPQRRPSRPISWTASCGAASTRSPSRM